MANGVIVYFLYFLNGISFLCFCDEVEEFELTDWSLAGLAACDIFFSVVFAVNAKRLKKFWVLAAGLLFVFNLLIWAIVTPNFFILLARRNLNLFFLTGFSVLVPCQLLDQQQHRVEMVASVLQSFFVLGCTFTIIFYTYCTQSLSATYLILAVCYLFSTIKLKNPSENLKISEISPSSLLLFKKPVLIT